MNKPVKQAKQVNIYEAKTQLSRLVERASKGENIVIAKSGTPMAKLVPLEAAEEPATRNRVRAGTLKGKIHVPDDFDDPLPKEVLELFYGGPVPE